LEAIAIAVYGEGTIDESKEDCKTVDLYTKLRLRKGILVLEGKTEYVLPNLAGDVTALYVTVTNFRSFP
jgi:hypothetical protein